MKNVIISFSIFAIMLIFMILSLNYLTKISTELYNTNNNIEKAINEEKWDKSYKATLDLLDKWNNYSDKISIFVHHEEIDTINIEIWKLTQYTKEKNKDESLSAIHVVKHIMKHIESLERVNIQNIL